MNYEYCLKEINAMQGRGIHRGLDRMITACHLLKNPQSNFPSIHIAGTNGKGSTAAIASEILKRARYKTGFTLSPHIENFRERIQINGEWIPGEELASLHSFLKRKAGHLPLTYFEWTILLALLYFASSRVDMAVVETGMGGRWDATNVITPLAGAITNVSLDHEAELGVCVEDILAEKMQILKPGVTAWTAIEQKPLLEILSRHCRSVSVPLHRLQEFYRENSDDTFSVFDYRDLSCRLAGNHQKLNAGLAVAVCQSLVEKGYEIPRAAFEDGIAGVRWPGRLETIAQSPLVIIDGAHNRAGIACLVNYIREKEHGYHLVFGTLKDRPFEEMLAPLLAGALSVSLAVFEDKKAFSRKEIEEKAAKISNLTAGRKCFVLEINPAEWGRFYRGIKPGDAVLVTGSLYLVSQVRAIMKEGLAT